MAGVGSTVPDFTLTGSRGDEITEFTLSEYSAGRPTMLVFYVYDFSPVCESQLCELNDMELLTFSDEIGVLGVSTDGPYSHRKFINANDLTYPLLTDPYRELQEQCGMVEEDETGRPQSKRGVVLLDGDRTAQYRWRADDHWAEWSMEPVREAYEVAKDLPGTK